MKLRFTPDPDEPVKRLWFMHCNRRHHSLGLLEIPHPAGCIHVMTEVNALDEVGRCNDRRIAAGVKLTGTMGRHANDHMVSFYMQSPAGFDVEYGAEVEPLMTGPATKCSKAPFLASGATTSL